MFPEHLLNQAAKLLESCKTRGLRLACAESCTGGLVIGCLTEVAGSSAVVERGFVTYTNESKFELLDVPIDHFTSFGAVSEPVARAMAEGALMHSHTNIAVSCTGIAGPGGGTATKPVGRVHLACAAVGQETRHVMKDFGDIGRSNVRLETVASALTLLQEMAERLGRK